MAENKTDFNNLKIEVLIRYVVNETECSEALAVVERFKHNKAASGVFRNYYATLPDAREEMVYDLRVVAENQGTYLFAIRTTNRQYLYVGSEEGALYQGEYENGIDNKEILLFFGFKNAEEFSAKLPKSIEDLKPLGKPKSTESSTCVACGVSEEDMHTLGCPVEQCPWCDGQLSRCNCRFEQLGVDQIDDDELLDRFEVLLEQKGRIAFRAEQSPSYPSAGEET